MIAPEHEDLIQRGLDQRLTPDEQAKLRVVLTRFPLARETHQRLRAVVGELEQSGQVDPPADLTAAVMRDVMATTQAPAAPRPAPLPASHPDDGRRLTIRRVWYGLATAAVILLGVTWFFGVPAIDVGTEGTIGTAGHQAEGLARAFFASDAFAALRRNPAARDLLAERAFREMLANDDCRTVLGDPALAAAITHPTFVAALADPSFLPAATVGAATPHDATLDPQVRAALTHPVMRRALASVAFQAASRSDRLRARLADPRAAAVMQTPEFRAVLADDRLPLALGSAGFDAALHAAPGDPPHP